MIAFLTSNTGRTVFKHGRYQRGAFYRENGLLSRMKERYGVELDTQTP